MKKLTTLAFVLLSINSYAFLAGETCHSRSCDAVGRGFEEISSITSPLTYLAMDSETIQDAEVTGALLVQEAFDEESDMKTTISVANELEVAPKHIQNAVVELFEAGEAVTVENINGLL